MELYFQSYPITTLFFCTYVKLLLIIMSLFHKGLKAPVQILFLSTSTNYCFSQKKYIIVIFNYHSIHQPVCYAPSKSLDGFPSNLLYIFPIRIYNTIMIFGPIREDWVVSKGQIQVHVLPSVCYAACTSTTTLD